MSISIHKNGVLDTIQDSGRTGFAANGINPSGVMDLLAMRTANALVANDLNEAVIELHFPSSLYHFNSAVLMALSGADFSASANGILLPINKTIFIPADTTVSFNHKILGERCCMAVHGGFDAMSWLGSKSTNLKLNLAGHLSHPIKKGDTIRLNKNIHLKLNEINVYPWRSHVDTWYDVPDIINILHGPEWCWLTKEAQQHFISTQYEIKTSSDRMALQLQGMALGKANEAELISSAVGFGTIQLLNNGLPIVLMADHQTTGGYPRIAQVITSHLPKLAQLSPHQKIYLLPTTLAKAEELLLSQQEELIMLQQAVLFRLQGMLA